jgi:hypothetical protein
MTANNLPQTDSIKELALFWDTHDLTDFDDQLQEVTETVFERHGKVLHVPLTFEQARALESLAQSHGVDSASLIRQWVQENIQPSS